MFVLISPTVVSCHSQRYNSLKLSLCIPAMLPNLYQPQLGSCLFTHFFLKSAHSKLPQGNQSYIIAGNTFTASTFCSWLLQLCQSKASFLSESSVLGEHQICLQLHDTAIFLLKLFLTAQANCICVFTNGNICIFYEIRSEKFGLLSILMDDNAH